RGGHGGLFVPQVQSARSSDQRARRQLRPAPALHRHRGRQGRAVVGAGAGARRHQRLSAASAARGAGGDGRDHDPRRGEAGRRHPRKDRGRAPRRVPHGLDAATQPQGSARAAARGGVEDGARVRRFGGRGDCKGDGVNMGESAHNFYEVLGIDRSADERAIKKAYFALVRKFPPETHPDDFKRIREAYEVLSNPQSRADYDAVNQYDQYGAEVSTHLKAGTEAMEQSAWTRAQSELIAVLEQQPQLHFARDLLGMAYLNAHKPADAMREFTRLVTEQPANAVYHLHKGYAHYAQNQYAPALDCYREARKLDPADTRSLVATADCLVAQKQYEPALLELDRAIGLDGQVDFNDFVFFMRKVQIQLLRDRGDLAEQELDQIFKILPDDPEVKKYVATRLASLASDLFAMKRSADANRLLARCRRLDPSRKSMEYTFPARTRLRIDALPEASQRWLAQHAVEPARGKLKHNAKAGPVLLVLVAAALQLAALDAGFAGERV